MSSQSKKSGDRGRSPERDGPFPIGNAGSVISICSSGYASLTNESGCTNEDYPAIASKQQVNSKHQCLEVHWSELIERIDPDTLSHGLVSKAVITISDCQKIRECSKTKQKELILFRVARGGERALEGLISVLREDNDDLVHKELGRKLQETLAFEKYHKSRRVHTAAGSCDDHKDCVLHNKRKSDVRMQWLRDTITFQNPKDSAVLQTEFTHFRRRREVIDGWMVFHEGQEKFAILLTDALALLVPVKGDAPFQWLSNSKYSCYKTLFLLTDFRCPKRMDTDNRSLLLTRKVGGESVLLKMNSKLQREELIDTISNAMAQAEKEEAITLSSLISSGIVGISEKCKKCFWKKTVEVMIRHVQVDDSLCREYTSFFCILKVGKEPVIKTTSATLVNRKAAFEPKREQFNDFCCKHDTMLVRVMGENKFQPYGHIGFVSIPVEYFTKSDEFRLQCYNVECVKLKMSVKITDMCATI